MLAEKIYHFHPKVHLSNSFVVSAIGRVNFTQMHCYILIAEAVEECIVNQKNESLKDEWLDLVTEK